MARRKVKDEMKKHQLSSSTPPPARINQRQGQDPCSMRNPCPYFWSNEYESARNPSRRTESNSFLFITRPTV